MVREVIAIEGKPTVLPGIHLEHGALQLPPECSVPIVHDFRYGNPVGWASDLQRDEATGEVSLEVKYDDPKFQEAVSNRNLYRMAFSAKQVTTVQVDATEEQPGYTLVTSAELIAVSSVPIPGYPAEG